MDKLQTYYRAVRKYREIVAKDPSCRSLVNALEKAGGKNAIEIVRMKCDISEDWIAEIEKQLPHVEKAVRAERQFIRREGEVVPIEKAKRPSRDSFQHLARHSNLLTREPEPGGDVIPDGIFIVEKESDYKVYENRFLYTLLCYMRDFIAVRLNKIIELGNIYRAKADINKKLLSDGRDITFSMSLSEDSKLDFYMMTDDETAKKIERIRGAQFTVAVLLDTPLMQAVSTAPLVRPPVTRTNVLKTNVDFKAALALYEYLTAYEGDGFTVRELRRTLDPLPAAAAGDFAETAALALFLTYEHGNDLTARLEAGYAAEEEAEKAKARAELAKRVAQLRRRIKESGGSTDEYMLALEEYNRTLESDSAALARVKEEMGTLRTENDRLSAKLADSDARAERAESDYRAQLTETARVRADGQKALTDLKSSLIAECDGKIAETRRAAAEQVNAAAKREGEIKSAYDALIEQKRVLSARVRALLHERGADTDEETLTEKENFDELEREYLAFYDLFDKQWKKTKIRIRKDVLRNRGKNDKQ